MSDSPKLIIPYIAESQFDKEVTHSEGVDILDILVMPNIKDRDLTAPPGSPAEGDTYIVDSVATGAWATHENDIAAYISAQWKFFTPAEGWVTYAQDENIMLLWDGAAWVNIITGGGGVPSTRLINTTTPLAGGGDLSADRTLTIADAVADGATKGAAAFTAADFNTAAGVVSIDYTNGQAASGSTKGFLTSADWTTFNNKGTGDTSSDTGTSVDSEIVLFSGTTGKLVKRATGSGIVKATSGVYSVVTAPAGDIVGTTDTQTLTNKRIDQRVVTVADATSITPNADTTDICEQANTQAAGTLTINAPTGTPTNRQRLQIIVDGTNAHTITFNAIYRATTDLALPTATSGSGKTDYMLFQYHSTDAKWDVMARNFGA